MAGINEEQYLVIDDMVVNLPDTLDPVTPISYKFWTALRWNRRFTGESPRHCRAASARSLTATYWTIRNVILDQELGGYERPGRGEDAMKRLAADLTARFGHSYGWHLEYERNIELTFIAFCFLFW